jgi:hypothetical protein
VSSAPIKAVLPGEPPTRFFARYTMKPAAIESAPNPLVRRISSPPRAITFTVDLRAPISLALSGADVRFAAAIGQANEIARREGVAVELYERLDVKEITGPWDLTRSWDWRQELRAVEEP